MALPLILFAAGTALSVFGQMQANRDQAQAEFENAAWLDQQAQFAEMSQEREVSIFERQAEQFRGEQIGSFAANNVELSGSALDILNDTDVSILEELEAIRLQGQFNIQEATLRARASRNNAARLTDPTTNFLQAGGTALTGAAAFSR